MHTPRVSSTRDDPATSGRPAAKPSLHRLLPWLSIRSKLIIAFTGLSILPVILVGLHGVFSNVRLIERIALENLTHDVQIITENASNFLRSVGGDLRVIRHSSSFEQLARVLERSPQKSTSPLLRDIRSELAAFARTKQIYCQLRLIGADGDELARVETVERADGTSEYVIVPDDELRAGRERFTFLLVDQLSGDQIALVPSEVLDRSKRIVPVVSFAMPIDGATRRLGVLVANVFARDLFHAVETRRHLAIGSRVAVVNGDGHYLYNSERKTDWNELLASREGDQLQSDFPPEIIGKLLSGSEGSVAQGSTDIIAYAPLFDAEGSAARPEQSAGFILPSFVYESVARETILAPVYSFARTFAGFLVVFLLGAIGLGLLATRQFTKPIAALHSGAAIIAEGNYAHRLHVETHDEIEMLADQFNSMAAALESHVEEILRHRSKLEELVELRTHELAAETTKLQTILDNVPSAIVLLDRDFRILRASAACASMTGRSVEELKGGDCRSLFGRDDFCAECVCRRALETGRIEYHIDSVEGAEGAVRFLEHLGIPMIRDGEVAAFLEIITDVTERRNFERHLLQTERLAAAGEMSAIIAHEFRNSLTSMKMILQLQIESKRLSRLEKNSLAVALTSIEHMEKIVSELLGFARPRPMEFKVASLNRLLEESLVLVQPQIRKQQIRVSTSFDAGLPALPLDAAHIKEAFVNILLNAVQAIGEAGSASRRGDLRIRTERHRLPMLMREPLLARGGSNGASALRKIEVVMEEGTECALIEIQDSGCGIGERDLRRIFDPFYTTKTNGTGLGLPMVRRTVNAHGGIITASSAEGEGSTFRFFLPLPPRAADHATNGA